MYAHFYDPYLAVETWFLDNSTADAKKNRLYYFLKKILEVDKKKKKRCCFFVWLYCFFLLSINNVIAPIMTMTMMIAMPMYSTVA